MGKLHPLFMKLNKYTFNGYLRLSQGDSEGYVTIKEGVPRNALLYYDGEEVLGRDALERIMQMDSREDLRIEVHTNIDIDKLVSSSGGELTDISLDEKDVDQEASKEHVGISDEVGPKSTKDSPEEQQRKLIEQELKKSDIREREIGVYDMLIKERKGIPYTEPEPFPERYTFENFIVGPNNKFAYAAALEISKTPGGNFNPFFINSASGLGKTHLLKAIGHSVLQQYPGTKVEYTTTINLSAQFFQSQDKLKSRFQDVDVLLLDDIQYLANQPDIQDMVDFVLQTVKDSGGQLVITADRPPEEIPLLSPRLVSRFKSGLVVEIKPPVLDTRRAILKKIVDRYDMDISDEVIDYIARYVKKSVRELEGALNRILAFSTLFDEDITLEGVRESLSPYIDLSHIGMDITFVTGRSYLIEANRAEFAFHVLKSISHGGEVNIFSRMNPQRISDEYGFKDANIYWLTATDSDAYETVPPNLESLTWHLEEKFKGKTVVLLDGIEYLIGQTGFDATIQFVRHIVDTVSEKDTIFLMTISPDALERKQISILEREMEVLHE